jgi:hypothetical protein
MGDEALDDWLAAQDRGGLLKSSLPRDEHSKLGMKTNSARPTMNYTINRNGEHFGPYSREELQRYLNEGRLLWAELVWQAEGQRWVTLAELLGGPWTPVPPLSQQLKDEVRARSLDALQGVKLFAKSPVGGLPESFALFDDQRAIQVGMVFAIVYEVAILLGALIFKSKAEALLGGAVQVGQLTGELSAAQLLKVLLLGLVPFASLIGACALARAIFRGKGRFAGDVYTAGAVLLPTGLLVLAAALLGAANIEIIAILFLFALTYSILILYAGCSRVGCISEAGAAPAVPIILLSSAWITKIIVVALW